MTMPSSQPPWRQAASVPSGTATSTASTMVTSASDSVGSSRSRISSTTVFRKKKDSPRSPCSIRFVQM
jgi:hypothetical protein